MPVQPAEAAEHLLEEGFEGCGKASLAKPRRWVLAGPEQVWVTKVHLYAAWVAFWAPLPYHAPCRDSQT